MQIEMKRIDEIRRYKNNPRNNKTAVQGVLNSIKEFGFKVPIIIDKSGEIIAGDTRYQAAKQLNLTEIPCICADDLTDEQVKAFRLADNKVAEASEWDFELLDSEISEILNIDMELFGFEIDDEVVGELVEEDEFEIEPPAEAKAKRGEIYKLGNHRVMCGDSTDIESVERLMGGIKLTY